METINIFFIIIIILILYIIYGNVVEKFQRMNYIQLHNYLENEYGNIRTKYYNKYPYRHTMGYNHEVPNTSLTGRLGYVSPPSVYNGYSGYNRDRLIGYLYSSDIDNNDIFKLYEVYDYRRGKPGYAYKDTKYPNNNDAILVNIDPKKYDGDYLYDGDTVNITYENKPFTVKLYKIKQTGLETRYTSRDYKSGMHEYALLEPTNPIIDIDEDDRYYIMYEQEIDPRRSLNYYYIKDKRGVIIELTDKPTKLYTGDTILLPGKERYGEYSIKELDKY